uniref:SxtJ n=1 Tax=Ignavibacterium album TaxID=591197 RepID=A0A7V3E7M5_9BACT
MLKEELKHIDASEKSVKKTGITVGVVLILISFILWWLGKNSFVYFSFAGGIFIILSYIAIPLLRPFHKLWIGLSLVLGFVMSRIILTILFYLVVTPIGLLAKLVGKKFMPLGFDKTAKTYWEKRERTVKEKIDYERQF